MGVGIGSSKHDLVGELLIILRILSSFTDSNASKAGGVKADTSVE